MPTELGARAPASALAQWTEQHCPDGHALMLESQNAQVAANLTIGNIITTLRLIGQVDWVELIEPVSRCLQVLRQLPSFCLESELTRQHITQAMERLARQNRRTEREVAEAVVAAAQAAPGELPATAAQRTAGFYLIGPGRPQLEEALGIPAQKTLQR
jgi:cyclic beta-1,2-glucan synthetase